MWQAIRDLCAKAGITMPAYLTNRPRGSLTNFLLPPWKLSFASEAKVSTGGCHTPFIKSFL